MVSGVEVLFGLLDIISYYSLMDVYQGEYESYLNNVDYAKVIETLIVEGTEWNYSNGKHKGFKTKNLIKVYHICQYFVCSRLMPPTHYCSMDK